MQSKVMQIDVKNSVDDGYCWCKGPATKRNRTRHLKSLDL